MGGMVPLIFKVEKVREKIGTIDLWLSKGVKHRYPVIYYFYSPQPLQLICLSMCVYMWFIVGFERDRDETLPDNRIATDS